MLLDISVNRYVVSDSYIYRYMHDDQRWLHQTKEELTAKANAGKPQIKFCHIP